MMTRAFRLNVVAPQATRFAQACSALAEGSGTLYVPANVPVNLTAVTLTAREYNMRDVGVSRLVYTPQWYYVDGQYGVLLEKGAGGTSLRYHRYDAAADQWTTYYNGFPGGAQPGHVWDCAALDPATGRIWYRIDPVSSVKPLYYYNAGTNDWVYDFNPYTTNNSVEENMGLEWFPEMQSFVYMSNGTIYRQPYANGATNGAATVLLATGSGGNEVAIYNPYDGCVYCSAGGSDYPGSYRVNADASVTVLGNKPIGVSNASGTLGRFAIGKNGSVLILETNSAGAARVWKLVGTTWTLQGVTHPFHAALNTLAGEYGSSVSTDPFTGSSFNQFVISHAHGCVVAIGSNSSGNYVRMGIWKPSV